MKDLTTVYSVLDGSKPSRIHSARNLFKEGFRFTKHYAGI